MKLFAPVFLLVFFLPAADCQIKVNGGLRFTRFPPREYQLDKGWKFQGGDNRDWARTDFGDSLWREVSLTDYQTYLPELLRQRIGWFRIKLWIDSPGTMNQAVLAISQLGASDYYINGQPFLHLGGIGANGLIRSDDPHFKPFLISGNLVDSLIIAIRFVTSGSSDRMRLFRSSKALPLRVTLSDWNAGLDRYEAELSGQRLPMGLSFLSIGVGILFLIFYIFFPENKLHLVFAAFCFCLGMIAGLQHQLSEGNLDIGSYSLVYFLSQFTDRLCSVLILALLSLIVFNKIGLFEWLVMFWFLPVCSLFIYFSPPGKLPDIALLMGRVLFMTALLRIAYFSFRSLDILPGVVALASAVLHGSFLLLQWKHNDYTAYYFQFNQMLCFALMGIYLVRMMAVSTRYHRLGKLR